MKRHRSERTPEGVRQRKRVRVAKEEEEEGEIPLVDDMLRAVAAFLFIPGDYDCFRRTCRQTRRALSHAPFLAIMEAHHFAPYRAVEADPMALADVPEQTRDLCLFALGRSGEALQCVREQTREYCLLTVERFPRALRYVRAQSEEICLAAIERCPYVMSLVREENMTGAICLAAVKRVGFLIVDVPLRLLTKEMSHAAAHYTRCDCVNNDDERKAHAAGDT